MSRSAVSNASAVRLTSMTKKQVSREQSINAIRLERANCALGLATQAIAQIADVCGRAFPRRRFPKMRIATAAAWGAMLKANDLLVSAARDIVNGNVSVDTWDKMRAAVDEDATVGFLSWWTDEEMDARDTNLANDLQAAYVAIDKYRDYDRTRRPMKT